MGYSLETGLQQEISNADELRQLITEKWERLDQRVMEIKTCSSI